MRRTFFALIATVSALLLAATLAPVATAQQSTAASARADIQVTIDAKIVDQGTRLKIWGKAPRWKRKAVLLQRKTVHGGVWKVVERDQTTRRGLYEFRDAPVPAADCKDFIFRTKVRSRDYRVSPVTSRSYSRC